MSISREIINNKFLLLLIEEQKYLDHMLVISRLLNKSHNIGYVCLSRPYLDVMIDMENNNVDLKNFFFIDVLSSHYDKPEPVSNCIFVDSPNNFTEINKAINKAIIKKRCDLLMFDTISTLSLYADNFSIINFTHNLISDNKNSYIKTLYFILKLGFDEDSIKLIKDLSMFADKTINLEDQNN